MWYYRKDYNLQDERKLLGMASKKLFIAEKPSVAQQFADALKVKGARKDG